MYLSLSCSITLAISPHQSSHFYHYLQWSLQKDVLRDVLRVAADKLEGHLKRTDENGLLGRANVNESLLHQHHRKPEIAALPEKLITYSMAKKAEETPVEADGPWHGNLFG
jgi:hypothetical protein